MTNIVQTPAEEIELTDAQLEAVCGAWDQDNGTSAPVTPAVSDTDDLVESINPSDGMGHHHIFFFKKDKKFVFLKKDENIKVLKIG